jgi:disulfide bond formation protein DsbB
MRTRMSSPLLLLVGLTLGLLAMWASVSPLGTSGDLVTGGWVACSTDGGSNWFGVPGDWHCENHCGSGNCSNDYSDSCSNYAYGNCSAGSITIVSCYTPGPYSIVSSSNVACDCTDSMGDFRALDYSCY